MVTSSSENTPVGVTRQHTSRSYLVCPKTTSIYMNIVVSLILQFSAMFVCFTTYTSS